MGYPVGCCGEKPESESAALIFRAVPALHGVLEIMSYWTFSMVFEEGALPTKEIDGTFGLLSLHGVPKPGWTAFALLHKHAGDTLLPSTTNPASSDVPKHCHVDKELGCWVDQDCKMFRFAVRPDNSVETCLELCTAAGWDLFGMEDGQDCRCGFENFNVSDNCKQAPRTQCSKPCPGNASQTCGQSDRLQAYKIACDPQRPKAPKVTAFATRNGTEQAAVGSARVFLSFLDELASATQHVTVTI